MYKGDGAPISSSLAGMGTSANGLSADELRRIRRQLAHSVETHIATVHYIYFIDDIRNKSGNSVEYEVQVEGTGERQGQVFTSVKALNLYGGMVNFSEVIYYPKTNTLNGQPNNINTYMFDNDATQVVIAFIDGGNNKPYIIGGWSNSNVPSQFLATTADGVRKLEEYNGIRTTIDQDGQFIMTYYGGQRDTKTFITENASTAPLTMMVDMTGAWQVQDKQNQTIRVDQAAQTLTLTQYANVKPNETYGQPDTSSPGAIVNQIIMDKAAKQITLNAGSTIAVGANNIELLQQISDQLNQLIMFLNNTDSTHVHIGNMGYNTSPPTTASQFTTTASNLSTIKSMIDSIKGSL